MRRAGILTGGVVALVLPIGVRIPQHPSSPLMILDSRDQSRLWFDRASLPIRNTDQAAKQHQPFDFSTEGMSEL